MQRWLLVLGLARQAVFPGEPQHVLHRVVDAQSTGVVERGAALVVLPGQQDLHAVMLKGWTHQGHTQTMQKLVWGCIKVTMLSDCVWDAVKRVAGLAASCCDLRVKSFEGAGLSLNQRSWSWSMVGEGVSIGSYLQDLLWEVFQTLGLQNGKVKEVAAASVFLTDVCPWMIETGLWAHLQCLRYRPARSCEK